MSKILDNKKKYALSASFKKVVFSFDDSTLHNTIGSTLVKFVPVFIKKTIFFCSLILSLMAKIVKFRVSHPMLFLDASLFLN